MRFNYLHDSVPDTIDRLRSMRIPEYLQWPAWTCATVLVAIGAASLILQVENATAQTELANAQTRLVQSKRDLANVRLQHTHVEELLALDTRLREIHLSGSTLSVKLADIANHVPSHAWLTALSRTATGISISGRAQGLSVLSDTFADLMSSKTVESPTLIRASKEDHARTPGLLSFDVHVEDRAQ